MTDAGDVVSGAKVAAGGKSAKTNGSGQATLIFPGKTGGYVTLTVTDPGYQPLQVRVKL